MTGEVSVTLAVPSMSVRKQRRRIPVESPTAHWATFSCHCCTYHTVL